jgi:hypothetical protein
MTTHDPAELNAALRAALSLVLVELDVFRNLENMRTHDGDRIFSPRELANGASLGLMAKLDRGRLVVWSDS